MKAQLLSSRSFEVLVALLGPESPYRGIVLAMATLILCIGARRWLRRWLECKIAANAFRPANAQTFLRGCDMVWTVIIGILVVIAASGSLALLGLTIGFFGTMLGWSLQAPIRGLAAWVMVLLKHPFVVGDRIQVAGVTGDVTEIQLNHVVLNQVGGTVQGEEKSGRGVFVPNAMLFGENIINYNLFQREQMSIAMPASPFILDEVLVRISFDSDYEFAKQVCLEAARQVVQREIGKVDEEPYVRSEFLPSGMLLRVRYKTRPDKRQLVSSGITEKIWSVIRANTDRAHFFYPVNVTRLVPAPGQPPRLPSAKPTKLA